MGPRNAQPEKTMTYAKAGVADIEGTKSVLAKNLAFSFSSRNGRVGQPVFPIGHYAGLVDLGDGRVLGLHVDNVGTKVLIANQMERFDTIGIDCVAMCANDLICAGLEPFAFLDYIAISKPSPSKIKAIAVGIVEGAKQADMAVVGGETAVVPDLLAASAGLDLVGMAAGICDKDRLVLGDKSRIGDILIGVASSGIHSNGLSLARKILLKEHDVNDWIPELRRSLGEELLEPTRIYVKPVLELLAESKIHGLAHITGGGLGKLNRIVSQAKLGAELDQLPDVPTIFKMIQEDGGIVDHEMYRTFNMGVGLVLVCPKNEEDSVIQTFERRGQDAFPLGKLTRRTGVRVRTSKGRVVSLLGKD